MSHAHTAIDHAAPRRRRHVDWGLVVLGLLFVALFAAALAVILGAAPVLDPLAVVTVT